jgi:hypothetical protein
VETSQRPSDEKVKAGFNHCILQLNEKIAYDRMVGADSVVGTGCPAAAANGLLAGDDLFALASLEAFRMCGLRLKRELQTFF